MILGNGGQYLKEDGTVDFSSPQAIEAFEELRRLVVDEKVTDLEGLTGGGDLEGYQQVFSGMNLFVPRGPWTIAEGIQTFELTYGKEFQYAPLPWYGDKISFAAETGWSLAVNANSKQSEAAFRFLEYFFQDDILLQFNISTATIPSKKSAAQSEKLLSSMPYLENTVNILDKGNFIGYFNTDQVKEALNNAFVDYCQGVLPTAQEALSKAAQAINDSKK
jgi:multiple sugar transport system substrate-binding protein